MIPDRFTVTYEALVLRAQGSWKGPGWPDPGSLAREALDALYWGDPAWDAGLMDGEPRHFGVRIIAGITRPLVTVIERERAHPGVLAQQWTALRSVLGLDKRTRARTLAAVPAAELDPIIRGCSAAFKWCEPDPLKRRQPPGPP